MSEQLARTSVPSVAPPTAPTWVDFVARDPHELELFVGFELVNRLALSVGSDRVDELAKWLTPMLGRQAAEVVLGSDLFNLLVRVADTAVAVGIAVERTRVLAKSGPRSKPGAEVDCERWVALALAESGLTPIEAKSLIPKAEQHAEK